MGVAKEKKFERVSERKKVMRERERERERETNMCVREGHLKDNFLNQVLPKNQTVGDAKIMGRCGKYTKDYLKSGPKSRAWKL